MTRVTAARNNGRSSLRSIALFIPNILCYIRIILSLISILTASYVARYNTSGDGDKNGNENALRMIGVTVGIWSFALFLDHIDGKIARNLKQCSELGVLLDIIADNILRGSSWICVVVASTSSSILSKSAALTTATTSTAAIAAKTTATEAICDTNNDLLLSIICIAAPYMAIFFISMEWFTMLSSQMLKVMKDERHWKDVGQDKMNKRDNTLHNNNNNNNNTKATNQTYPEENDEETIQFIENHINSAPPRFVNAIFLNNFCNTFGILSMYGLFSVGMITFLYIHKCLIIQSIPFLRIPLMIALLLAYIGRLLALYVETWLCFDHLRRVTYLDLKKREIEYTTA